ncbi:haloacid dehalogenase superfamily, subfamily IA, variant 1 with third motif having Dx(3-4)D or Dx(3-4)E [Actinokineospora globicatena]|nr:haloacid dehalogenase superfamily, subfamily IA, variant 1 with third motif having Dx(3-4)D or Dx(3-4)E [Actinokineospora globicatena]
MLRIYSIGQHVDNLWLTSSYVRRTEWAIPRPGALPRSASAHHGGSDNRLRTPTASVGRDNSGETDNRADVLSLWWRKAMVAAVVFDVGETLLDDSREWGAWADWVGVSRHTFSTVLGAVTATGRDNAETFQHFRPDFDLTHERQLRESARRGEVIDEIDLRQDVRPALAQLRARALWMGVTENQAAGAGTLLRELNLPVDRVATSGEWGATKPAPEFFERVVAMTPGGVDEVVYVGDHPDNDVVAAKAAGSRTGLIRRGPWVTCGLMTRWCVVTQIGSSTSCSNCPICCGPPRQATSPRLVALRSTAGARTPAHGRCAACGGRSRSRRRGRRRPTPARWPRVAVEVFEVVAGGPEDTDRDSGFATVIQICCRATNFSDHRQFELSSHRPVRTVAGDQWSCCTTPLCVTSKPPAGTSRTGGRLPIPDDVSVDSFEW